MILKVPKDRLNFFASIVDDHVFNPFLWRIQFANETIVGMGLIVSNAEQLVIIWFGFSVVQCPLNTTAFCVFRRRISVPPPMSIALSLFIAWSAVA
jgi:hypothetical protein